MPKVTNNNGQVQETYTGVYNMIPSALISAEVDGPVSDVLNELGEICKYYKIYKKGAQFIPEGSHGDYVPSDLPFQLAATLIDKEARFMFAEKPDITIKPKADVGVVSQEAKNMLTTYQDLVDTVMQKNNWEGNLLRAAKDCFVGKRVACLVNWNEDDGVTISFIPSTHFVWETALGNPNVITKFVCFQVDRDSLKSKARRIFKKKYIMHSDGYAYLEETLYDGAGQIIQQITPETQTLLKQIPVAIILNDGLTGDLNGETDVSEYSDSWYSKLANADIDADRKSMNPVVYTVDMDSTSTKGLSRSAGSFWDLQSDQGLGNPNPSVGVIESNMSYSDTLGNTLSRIRADAYDRLDIPNINIETMVGSITSGKALKAIYWPLIVRCKEKMKSWGPQIRKIVELIVEGSQLYPNCITQYTSDVLQPVDYSVDVVLNIPIQEDESEEKQLDLAEVQAQVMSRKAYMKKWRGLSDSEVDEELRQIALERQYIDDAAFPGNTNMPVSGVSINPDEEEVDQQMVDIGEDEQ